MRIGIVTDHGGFGAHQLMLDDDYPDFVIPLGQEAAAGKVERGLAVGGSGVGAPISWTSHFQTLSNGWSRRSTDIVSPSIQL